MTILRTADFQPLLRLHHHEVGRRLLEEEVRVLLLLLQLHVSLLLH